MRNKLTTITIILSVLFITESLSANSAPVVSNVTASQRGDDSKLVDIYYSLTDADGDNCTVWVFVSDDDGVSWRVPAWAFSGHVGAGVTPGSKHVVWDAATDVPGRVGSFKVRVYADDGNGTAPKVLVPGGWFPYQNTSDPDNWVYVDSFFIDKYEVTNQFYCQFLNAGGHDGCWDSSQEIVRSGETGNYFYSVEAGKENHPIRWLNYIDAQTFCTWRSDLEGMTYRLPTYYEWEKAAAWDPIEQHFYQYAFHSDSIDSSWCNYLDSGIGTTTEVGHYNGGNGTNDAKSYYGCYDMNGNVREFLPGRVRGGSFNDSTTATNNLWSGNVNSDDKFTNVGFRCVMVVDP